MNLNICTMDWLPLPCAMSVLYHVVISPCAVAIARELQSELGPAPKQKHLVGWLHVLLEEGEDILVREGSDLPIQSHPIPSIPSIHLSVRSSVRSIDQGPSPATTDRRTYTGT